MTSSTALVSTLAGLAIARAWHPASMDWPLVAAAFVANGGQTFLGTAANVMKLEATGYRAVHAEDLLLAEHELEPAQEVDIVVIKEPCGHRQGQGLAATSCSERVVEWRLYVVLRRERATRLEAELRARENG